MFHLFRTIPGSSIRRLLMSSAWIIAAASILLYGGTAAVIISASVATQARAVRGEREAATRALLKNEAKKAVAYMERNRADTLVRLQAMLAERVDEALSIAENIARANRAAHRDTEIARMITDALRPIRFNGGRGYYFATRLDGKEMLFPDRPEMEGRNLLGMTDTRGRFVVQDMIDLVRAKGEGFYSYIWTKPGVDGRDFPKLARVKLFRPLGWLIGTGEYLDDFERETKQQVISRLSTVSFGADGYLFAGQWDGVTLMGPAQGQNMIDTTDVNGVRVVEELIRAARAGGGFVQYVMPGIGGKRQLPKLSYVLPVPEWQWYVGGGQYLADMDAEIGTRMALLIAVSLRQAAWLGAVLLLLLGGMLAAAAATARRLTMEFAIFDEFFREVARARAVLPTMESGRLQFSELRSLSLTVNRILSERAAVEAERVRLATAIEQADEAVIITNSDLVMLYVNPAYERITGRAREDVLGRRPRYLDLQEPDERLTMEQIEAACAEGRSWFGRIRMQRIDGTAIQLEMDISPIRDPAGQLSNFTIVARDITERLKLESKIAHGSKMEALGRLAGGIAHDFNNLLQVINGYGDLAISELPSEHPSLSHLAQVRKAAGQATDLVRQLLTFSRRDAFKPRAIEVNNLIADLVGMLVRMIGEHVEVVVRPADLLPAISADPVQLRQVVINLCVNARDAMPEGGRILISTSSVHLDELFCSEHHLYRAGTYVLIEVSDHGIGIPPEIRERIFEPFFTTKEVGKGTGLGLATVYGIVRQHKGLILVESEVGKGTSVRVFFPSTDQPPEAEQRQPDTRPVSGVRRTILLAEDERQVRELTAHVLERAGYRVMTTADGEEALRTYEEHARGVDLALLDMVMPKLGGNAVRDRLRAMRGDLPILMATGYDRDQPSSGFVPGEHDRLLRKPWSAQELLQAIQELLPGADTAKP